MTKELPGSSMSPVSEEWNPSNEDKAVGLVFFPFLLTLCKSILDKHLGIKITAKGRALTLKMRNLWFSSPWKSSSTDKVSQNQSKTSLIFLQLQTRWKTRKKASCPLQTYNYISHINTLWQALLPYSQSSLWLVAVKPSAWRAQHEATETTFQQGKTTPQHLIHLLITLLVPFLTGKQDTKASISSVLQLA